MSENVFIQAPRVSFGEPPVSSAPSSLLTFADIVLSFDRKTALQNIKSCKDSNFSVALDLNRDGPKPRVFDHTYASCRSSRATRSQTAKSALLPETDPSSSTERAVESNSDTDSDLEMDLDLNSSCDGAKKNISGLDREMMLTDSENMQLHSLTRTPPSATTELFSAHNYCMRSKRCSSEENISSEALHSHRDDCNKEWPQTESKLDKHSRKSCSTEDVEKKTCIKSCKSSESVQKGSVSQTLHRFVNNTLEFPCWPRKADHTYATATWDGTAASHSLFEQDRISGRPTSSFETKTEDYPMEEMDNCSLLVSPGKHTTVSQAVILGHTNMQQKEDHTYVKHAYNSDKTSLTAAATAKHDATDNSSTLCHKGLQNRNSSPSNSDNHATWPHRFSSATFPRLKTRDDHTYFHSGLSGSNSSATGGREWVSAQTVSSAELSQDMQIEETYRSLHSFAQSASAKKDHNYSTSA